MRDVSLRFIGELLLLMTATLQKDSQQHTMHVKI